MSRWFLSCVMLLGLLAGWPTVSLGQATDVVSVEAAAGTARQQQWLAATPQDRVRLAEALGDDGARGLAKAKGYEAVYDGFDRMLPQGPDQVYRSGDGRVIVYEAKGGSGQLGHAYGHAQGSAEWAVESAKRVLRSTKASQAERAAAREILKAAARGEFEVHVIRTRHVLGEPTVAVKEAVAKTTDDAVQLANSALDDFARQVGTVGDDAGRTASTVRTSGTVVDDVAQTAQQAKVARAATKGLVFVGVAVDAGYRAGDAAAIERQYAAGKITQEQREVEHAKNGAAMVGGWGGAIALGKAGAITGGTFGGPWGAAAGGVAGGISGYFGGEAAAEAAAEWTMNRLHETGTTLRDAWYGLWGS